MDSDIPGGVAGQGYRYRGAEFQPVIDKVSHHPAQGLRWDPHHPGALLGAKPHRPANVGIIAGDTVEKGVKVQPLARLRQRLRGAGEGDTFAHQAGHIVEILQQFVAQFRLVGHLHPQLHPGDRRLQIVGDGGEDPRPLLQMIVDAGLHRIKRAGGTAHLLRPLLGHGSRRVAGRLKRIHRMGKTGDGQQYLANRVPGAGQQEDKLSDQHHR
ncbi:Uncharacterised protein [Klebsiella quasipneumoniae]|nr:Uncharacterised protein [Klebsiella quasipneumoniae]